MDIRVPRRGPWWSLGAGTAIFDISGVNGAVEIKLE